ncbi:hypothetical protein GCM10009601_44870 [Streptomyces thermospinosisporus]|uniref:Uncharacterized protein n=1 Tax=Streptomyces thermospinosisporus TaxID=161482 RepID=A0ABN1Z3I0_9ACTN
MQIRPRPHVLELWQAMARHCFDGGEWDWGERGGRSSGERGGRSSVTDAERLLCLLYPATEIPAFRLDDPDSIEKDVQQALQQAGGRADIPASLMRAMAEFLHIEVALRRARGLVDEQPGRACALAVAALGQLDALALARETADRGA